MLYFLFFPAEKAHDRQNLKEPVQNFGHELFIVSSIG